LGPDYVARSSVTRLENPYEILQVSPRASTEVIRAAYRVLARNYHPDVSTSPTAAEHMQQLNAAYNALIDPRRRAQFDAQLPIDRAGVAARRRLNAPVRTRTVRLDPITSQPRLSRPLLLALSLGVFLLVAGAFVLAVSFAIDALDAPIGPDQFGQAFAFAAIS
jgi:DnaJ domain